MNLNDCLMSDNGTCCVCFEDNIKIYNFCKR